MELVQLWFLTMTGDTTKSGETFISCSCVHLSDSPSENLCDLMVSDHPEVIITRATSRTGPTHSILSLDLLLNFTLNLKLKSSAD